MQVFKGTYKSITQGNCPAVWLKMSNFFEIGVADFQGINHQFKLRSEFIEEGEMIVPEAPELKSVIFPKVADFFKDNIKSMTIDINFQETK